MNDDDVRDLARYDQVAASSRIRNGYLIERPEGFVCSKCGKTFEPVMPSNVHCLVMHGPGDCCHFGWAEVKPAARRPITRQGTSETHLFPQARRFFRVGGRIVRSIVMPTRENP